MLRSYDPSASTLAHTMAVQARRRRLGDGDGRILKLARLAGDGPEAYPSRDSADYSQSGFCSLSVRVT